MKQSQRIAKNTVFGLLAVGVGGGLQFISVLVVARFLGVVEFGIFSYLLAFASVFQMLADFGLGNILIREMARRPGEMERLFRGGRALMWIFTGGTFVLMLGLVAVLPLERQTRELSLFMGVAYLLLLQSVSYVSVLRATEQMEYNAIGFSAHKALLVGLLVVVLALHGGLWGAVWCHFGANLAQVFYYRWTVGRKLGLGADGGFAWDFPLWKSLAAEMLPLGLSLGLRQFSWQTEVFLLKYLATPLALGLFSGPYRFLMGLTLFSGVLAGPLFPMFVRLAKDAPAQLAEAFQRTVRWFYIFALPVVAACMIWPHTLILLLLGKSFLPAVPLLRLLGLAVVPLCLTGLYPVLYSTLHETGRYLGSVAGVLALRVMLGAWLILHLGYIGACLSVVAAEVLLLLVLCRGLQHAGLRLEVVRDLMQPLLPFGVLAALFCLARHAPLVRQLAVAVGAVPLYFILLWRLKSFSARELDLMREAAGFAQLYLAGLLAKRKAHA